MENFKFNFSKNSDFVELLRKVSKKHPLMDQRIATFNLEANPPYVETLTSQGIGYTFNLVDDILDFNM